jgi:hypothetical protein
MQFIIVYDRDRGALIEGSPTAYEDRDIDRALEHKFTLEKKFAHQENIEIALLEGRDEEMLQKTHGRYFRSLAEMRDRPVV